MSATEAYVIGVFTGICLSIGLGVAATFVVAAVTGARDTGGDS